jgi:uncharacterized protein (TIGR03435 family)
MAPLRSTNVALRFLVKGQARAMNSATYFLRQSRLAVVLIAVACFALSLPAEAQDKPTSPPTSTPATAPANPASFAYDVVSIKPYKVSPDAPVMVYSTDDGFSYRGTSLVELVLSAYPIQMLDQVSGLPEWANGTAISTERFAIEAKMDEETAAALKKLPMDQQLAIRRSMMQAVLADRFNLKVHKETRVQPVYNLVIAKNGPKFKETQAGKEIQENYGWGEISGNNIEIAQILGTISGNPERFVVDKTGLTGKYTLSLKWNPLAGQDSPAWFTDQYADQFKGRPDIFIALEEQLGLKLEPAKGPVDVYVIDHVEKPSEN